MNNTSPYSCPLVWLGNWATPMGLVFHGFHLWDHNGVWRGVYRTQSRAHAEARSV